MDLLIRILQDLCNHSLLNSLIALLFSHTCGGQKAPPPTCLIIYEKQIISLFATATVRFSITTSSKKVVSNDCDNDRQPDIAIWPPKPEVLIALELWWTASKCQQQISGFQPCEFKESVPRWFWQRPTTGANGFRHDIPGVSFPVLRTPQRHRRHLAVQARHNACIRRANNNSNYYYYYNNYYN